jgi:hypothetical protein
MAPSRPVIIRLGFTGAFDLGDRARPTGAQRMPVSGESIST